MRDTLRVRNVSTPDLDARLLAQKAFGLDALGLLAHEGDAASPESLQALDELAQRRLGGEPVARILGHQEFYGLDFALSPATLVPRPETEALVDLGIATLRERPAATFLDLGTGTGCIAIALLVHLPNAKGVAVDLSLEALQTAEGNAHRHKVDDRLELLRGSWFEPIPSGRRFDLILSNPPYIATSSIPELMPEVREHDPFIALDGGTDGLDAYRAIAKHAADYLAPGGLLAFEIGAGQAGALSALLLESGFADPQVERDLAGLERVVFAHHL